jgi:hypothetical protein
MAVRQIHVIALTIVELLWCPDLALARIGIRQEVPIGGGASVMMHLLDPQTLPVSRASELVLLASKSTCTTSPTISDCKSMINPLDRVIVTNRHIVWLDLVPKKFDGTNGGAGMMRGLWTIRCCNGTDQYNFAFIEGEHNWAPNEMLPGANGNQATGSGVSLQMRLIENHDIWNPYSMGAENSEKVQLTIDGATINDGGLFSGSGVFYQTSGLLAHFTRDQEILRKYGFDDAFDLNTTLGVVSNVNFVLTYRFSAAASHFRQEMSLTAQNAYTSSMATYLMSTCGLGNATWSYQGHVAGVGRIRNRKVSLKDGCQLPPQYAASQWVAFNETVWRVQDLDVFENAKQYDVNTTWTLTSGTNTRTLSIRPVSSPPFQLPEHMQPLLNGYSMLGFGVVCIDAQYTDVNQCGLNRQWPPGETHYTALDYSTL